MIRSIRLINWRSHSDTSLSFKKGTNLLVGIMGAGKSSVLEGLSFALFGTFPALERRKLRQEDIIRLNEPEAKVVLELSWDGVDYRIERILSRGKRGVSSSAEIYKAGALIESGQSAVTDYVQRLLCLDYDLFTRAIYSEQNNIDYFLTIDPRRRKQEMDALLGLDRFETARANCSLVASRIKAKRTALEGRFDPARKAKLEADGAALEAKRQELSSSITKDESILKGQEAALKTLSERYDSVRKARERHEALRIESIKLQALCESLAKESEGFSEEAIKAVRDPLTAIQAAREDARKKLRQSEEALLSISKDKARIEASLKDIRARKIRAEALSKELSGLLAGREESVLRKTHDEAEKRLRSFESERSALSVQVKEIQDLLPRLHSGSSRCPLCDSALTDDSIKHVQEEKRAAIARADARMAELSKLIAEAAKERDSSALSLRRIGLINESLVPLKDGLSEEGPLSASLDSLSGKAEELSDALSSIREGVRKADEDIERLRFDLRSMEERGEKRKRLASSQARLDAIGKELTGAAFDEKAYEALRAELESARLSESKVRLELSGRRKELSSAIELSAHIKGELSALNDLERELRLSFNLEEQLSIYKAALSETQASLRVDLIDAINRALNEVFSIFYPYKNYRSLRLQASEKDYLFEVDDGRGYRPLESVASGGERACAALALRVSLAMVLTPSLSWLVLDEPSHNLDSQAISMLSEALQFKVPQVVAQTFVITHEEALIGSEFASSYRLSREKEENRETVVEAL